MSDLIPWAVAKWLALWQSSFTILCMTITHKVLVNMLGYKKNASITVVRELADAKLGYDDIMSFR